MKSIDDFLSYQEFQPLQSEMMGEALPWFYNRYTVHPDDKIDHYQFTHVFFNEFTGQRSPDFEYLMGPVIKKLNLKRLIRIKANLNPKTLFHRNTGWHYDYDNMITAIFYLNTCNGWTQFKRGGKVKCVANRVVIFDSNLEHAGITCTDQKRKVVINFNYEV